MPNISDPSSAPSPDEVASTMPSEEVDSAASSSSGDSCLTQQTGEQDAGGATTVLPLPAGPSQLVKKKTAKNSKNDSKKKRPSFSLARMILLILRSVLLDLPLALLFASWLTIYLVRHVHDDFYVPLFDRATRTDAQLQEEFTYYERQCTDYDLTTDNLHDMLVDTQQQKDQIVPSAVHQMLKHGGTVIPNVLKQETVTALRDYIVRRNAAVAEEERYPMSQGERRLSYGLDASEDPAVAAAVSEVAHHTVVRPLLAALLGDDDPASAEITVITAYAGAQDQVWHQDTKQDGNAVKFARTYSHSYSLFLPLQNTTEKMGATDVAPGTHMCANDIETLCDRNKLGLHLVGDDHGFPAGDGALLNQHVWHRGGAHTDPTAPERIVFVLSFLARPKFDRDPRQLSRGTYFHQKWLMWGHTWKDLLNPLDRMRRPFSVLRCLSLWKPSDANWGYDLITSGFMRFANEQLEYEDFEERFLPRLDQFHFPEFLRGRHIQNAPQKITWTVFLRETIDKVYAFVSKVNIYAHCGYTALLLIVALGIAVWKRPSCSWVGVVGRATFRLMITHGLPAVAGFALWYRICHSKWGRSVASGTALMRPFPSPDQAISILEQATLLHGPTTLPTRNDVLVGTRYDAEFLGSYNMWLDYHPGNALLREVAASYSCTYAEYRTKGLGRTVFKQVAEQVQRNGGRFLGQDYMSGDWIVMDTKETLETIAGALVATSSETLAAVLVKVNRIIAHHRFGPRRDWAMSKASHIMLWHLRRAMILGDSPPGMTSLKRSASAVSLKARDVTLRSHGLATFAAVSSATGPPSIPSPRGHHSKWLSSPTIPSIGDDGEDFREGKLVWCAFDDFTNPWFPGTVTEVDDSGEWFVVAFEDGSFEEGLHRSRLRKFTPVTEDDRVEGCFAEQGLEDCYPGTVLRVWASGYVAIAYDDGEYDPAVPPTKYYVPPYLYEGPFPY